MANDKVKVYVAWDRAASDHAEQHGILKTIKVADKNSWHVDVVEFDTEAEAHAYCRGVSDGNGWDEPLTQIF